MNSVQAHIKAVFFSPEKTGVCSAVRQKCDKCYVRQSLRVCVYNCFAAVAPLITHTHAHAQLRRNSIVRISPPPLPTAHTPQPANRWALIVCAQQRQQQRTEEHFPNRRMSGHRVNYTSEIAYVRAAFAIEHTVHMFYIIVEENTRTRRAP